MSQPPLKLSWTPHAMWTLVFSFVTVCLLIIFIQTETYHDFMKDSSSDLIEPLMPPMVRIQGGRNRLSSEICSYSDYEFPLDEAWEIAPRNRLVGSLIKLNNLCSAAIGFRLTYNHPGKNMFGMV